MRSNWVPDYHSSFSNFLRLSPLTFMALADGNLTNQILCGMVALNRLDLVLTNGLFSIAGVGAWVAAMTLEGSRRQRLLTLVPCFLLDLGGIAICVASAYTLATIFPQEYVYVVRIFGALAVCSIGYLIMGVHLPLGNKLPWMFVGCGVTIAVLMSLLTPRMLVPASIGMVNPAYVGAALFLTVLVGFASVLPFAWAGQSLGRHIEFTTMRLTAGIVVIAIAALMAGLQLTPLYLAAGGVTASVLLKRGHKDSSENKIKVASTL